MGYFHDQIDSMHYGMEIASRRLTNILPVNIFGVNREIGTDYETIWTGGGILTYPSSAVQMDCVSSSASDTMSIVISGLDANYEALAEIVTLNGTSAVTTTNSFYRINSAVILSGSNVGNITISNGGTTYAHIAADLGSTQACSYTIPADHSLYIFRISMNSGTVNINRHLTARNVVRNSSGRTLRVAEVTFSTSQVNYDRQIPFRIAEKTDFQFECVSAASFGGDNEVSIFVECVLMKDKYDA